MNYAPKTPGLVELAPSLRELVPYIDWSALLNGWGFRGTLEMVLADPVKKNEAEKVLLDAREMLTSIMEKDWITPRGVCAVFPCERCGDDILVDGRVTLHTLRQQQKKESGIYYALSDFVKPKDFIGMFAVTAGDGLEPFKKERNVAGDAYSAILAQMLADRIAEAFAEWTHAQLRRDIWGYVPDEKWTPQELLSVTVQGIRPAPGYPCQPDHSEKFTIFQLLDVGQRLGVTLTESALMVPESSVCAVCFARPQSTYFAVGRIGDDQFEDYRKRKGWDRTTALRWLGSVYSETH